MTRQYLLDDHIYNLVAELEYIKTEIKEYKRDNKDTSVLLDELYRKKRDIRHAKAAHLADKVEDLEILEYKVFNNYKLSTKDFLGLKTRLSSIDRSHLGQVLLGIDLLNSSINIYKG